MFQKTMVRERIPTIFGVYEPVKNYLEQLRKFEPWQANVIQSLPPVDALLISLFLDFQKHKSVVVDLSSHCTYGGTTLLCATRDSVSVVFEHLSNNRTKPVYAKHRSRFLKEWDERCLDRIGVLEASTNLLAWRSLLDSLQTEPSVVFVFHTNDCSGDKLVEQIRSCLDAIPHANCLVLGLGHFGECQTLTSLARLNSLHCATRVRLCRELEGAFFQSQLGVVYRQDSNESDVVLQRMGQLYEANYNYLDLVARLAEECVAKSSLNVTTEEPTSEAPVTAPIPSEEPTRQPLVTAPISSNEDLLKAELLALKSSKSFKLGSLFLRVCRRLAPPASVRHRVLSKSYRALQILRHEGVRGLARRVRS